MLAQARGNVAVPSRQALAKDLQYMTDSTNQHGVAKLAMFVSSACLLANAWRCFRPQATQAAVNFPLRLRPILFLPGAIYPRHLSRSGAQARCSVAQCGRASDPSTCEIDMWEDAAPAPVAMPEIAVFDMCLRSEERSSAWYVSFLTRFGSCTAVVA